MHDFWLCLDQSIKFLLRLSKMHSFEPAFLEKSRYKPQLRAVELVLKASVWSVRSVSAIFLIYPQKSKRIFEDLLRRTIIVH